ncbi:hypothetical protein HPB52_001487 [Rhipicephalus sanguineus]|uniref:GH18 domain-containing protein n=1 Tax=Rhipicephalus sanguineus TaxID=34632 RepID=A0A9D4PD27_RHISA|nr:hypothetical protein HPB52_001487 [Rhipicephalus sanguineus]
MEETSSDESLSGHTPAPVSQKSRRPFQVAYGDNLKEESTAAASAASPAASPARQQVREIVLVLRPPEPAEPADSRDQRGSLTRDLQFRQGGSGERTQTPSDERVCLQLWGLWAALTLPLLFSMWLFLVPFLVNRSPHLPGESTAFSAASATPEPCLKTVNLREPSLPIRISQYPGFGPSKLQARPFFCLVRNNAVAFSRNYSTVGQKYDYTFWSVPFDLCHYVIYWSVAIEDGNVTSRLPSFDESYGLNQLRSIADLLGYSNVKILVALGGYPEDGPHFSLLGRDPGALDRLTAKVVDAMKSKRLDGVTVNWVDPGPRCGSPDDQGTVAALLRAIRQAFDKNGMTQALVTAMLDGGTSIERLVSTSKDAVNYFFLTDHRRLSSGPGSFYEVCTTFSDNTVQTLDHYVNSVPGLRRDQICAAEPVAALAADGDIDVATRQFMIQPGRALRWAPIYEACGKPRFCRLFGASQSCIVHQANWGARPNSSNLHAATLYFNDLTYLIRARYLARSQPPIRGEPCIFVTLLEYDNYAGQCGRGYNRYLLLQHLYYGTLGDSFLSGSIEDAAPPYNQTNC